MTLLRMHISQLLVSLQHTPPRPERDRIFIHGLQRIDPAPPVGTVSLRQDLGHLQGPQAVSSRW